MRIGRTIPPAAAPLSWRDLWHALIGVCSPRRALRTREEEIKQWFGVEYVFLVSSGSAALALTLQALRSLSPKSEVVIPAYTCFSVPAAVLKAGLEPTLCDISPATFDFDHQLLARSLTARTLCVVSHHLFGVPSDIERTRAICQARGILVIEDAAQAMGGSLHGRTLGTVGDVGIFSLGRGKNITCGAGGVIVTRSREIGEAIARRYRALPSCSPLSLVKDFVQLVLMTVFIRPGLYWIPAALPFLHLGETIFPSDVPIRRMSGMKAGLLRSWRTRLHQSNQIRSETSAHFSEWLSLPVRDSQPYLRLPILVSTPSERQRLYSLSKRRGLGVSLAYPTPVNEIPEVRATFNGQRFPQAQRVAQHLLTIPTHQWLSERDRRAIVALFKRARTA
jgi:dTDP-4-amino-4,6-dideoxygalactose transaminase